MKVSALARQFHSRPLGGRCFAPARAVEPASVSHAISFLRAAVSTGPSPRPRFVGLARRQALNVFEMQMVKVKSRRSRLPVALTFARDPVSGLKCTLKVVISWPILSQNSKITCLRLRAPRAGGPLEGALLDAAEFISLELVE